MCKGNSVETNSMAISEPLTLDVIVITQIKFINQVVKIGWKKLRLIL